MNNNKVLSLSLNCFSKTQVLSVLRSALGSGKKTRVATINNEISNIAFEDKKYSNILNSFELKIPDSAGVAWVLRRNKTKTEVIKGVDLALNICELSQEMSKSIFLLGGNSGIGRKSSIELKKLFPNLKIAGYIDGVKINPQFEPNLVGRINNTKPDIIFVCLGAPKQELWIDSNYQHLDSSVFVGLGGTLDFISKTIPRAPKIMRMIGLEWLFRFAIQPSRYKRIFSALIIFPLRVLLSSHRH
jgi:N-acetylglucosaminyldiphosphoundecaprenol N-acetyl-beta-D-mannosaminyltransferase